MTSVVNRYYDPATDEFLSIDPDVATTNQPYLFTNDDPQNAEDPLGLLSYDPCPSGNKSCLKKARADAMDATNALVAAVNVVRSHVGDIATVVAIGVCIGTIGTGCAIATALAYGARVIQRSEEGVPIISAANLIDAGITAASGGLLAGPSALGGAALEDSPTLTYLLRVHTALPDILGWGAGQATNSDIP